MARPLLRKDLMTVAERYIEDVLSGKQIAGQLIIKACQRHKRDLSTGAARGFWFDRNAGQYVIDFIQTYCFPPNDTEPMKLLPWQQAWLYILFGWKRANGFRRWKRTYLAVAKKNGKTSIAAALCLYFLVADGELSARVFIAATTGKQAKLCMTEATLMLKRSPELQEHIRQAGGKTDDKQVHALYVPETGSRLSCLARDAASEDGAVVSAAVLDELHHWKTGSNLYSILRYGGDTRPQPMLVEITTAGSSAGNTSLCWNEHEYGMKVLDGVIDDDEFCPFIFCMDPKDNWEDPSNWIKANPSLGVLISMETMLNQYNEAKGKPSSLGDFKRFRLNIWSENATEPAIDLQLWDACVRTADKYPDRKRLRQESLEELKGRLCFAGLDLAPKGDTSALVLLFPPLNQGEKWRLIPFIWIPNDNIGQRVKADRVPYDRWHEDGFLKATEGSITDVRVIAQEIVKLSRDYRIKELAYDRAFSEELIRMLGEEGFNLSNWVQYPQTHIKMNGPSNELMRKVSRKDIAHDADPVLRWQIANLRWNTMKSTGYIKPDKDRRREKNDACVALIMALGRASDPENLIKPQRKFFCISPED
jgi:phage terminase large subunit-like protein